MEQMITPEKLTNRFCGNLGLANMEFLRLATAVIATFRNLRVSEARRHSRPLTPPLVKPPPPP